MSDLSHLVDWTKAPLYEVQKWSVRSPNAAAELARRYAVATANYGTSERHQRQVASQWLLGWKGEQDPYLWKGGNFAAPMRSAYRSGKRERRELEALVAAWEKEGAK